MTETQSYYHSDTSNQAAATERETALANTRLLNEFLGHTDTKGTFSSGEDNKIGEHILPGVDLTGFDQETEYKSSGMLDSAWHTVKHIFIRDDTVADKMRDSIVAKMSPEERKQYDREEEALEKHRSEVRNWGLQMTLEPGPRPKNPSTPMHDAIQKRLEQAERDIEKQVRAGMTPEERRALDAEMTEYIKSTQIGRRPVDPLGTGGFQPLPTPGPAIREYYRRIAQAAETYLQKH